MKAREREVRKLAERAGLKIIEIGLSGGNHIRMRVQRADGQTCVTFAALTPSDRRGSQNKLSELRRFATGRENPRKH